MTLLRFVILLVLHCIVAAAAAQSTDRPNILWISCEDMSPHLSFYADNTIATPNLDRLAREGVVYDNVFATAGVCAPSRCAIITGVNQVTAGGHNMRTLYSTFPEKTGLPKSYSIVPPVGLKAFPEYLREQGYYCTNNSKTDYQFEEPPTVWDVSSATATWRNRKPGQPFFAVVNYLITHESQVWIRKDLPLHADPAKIKVPPYYPDTKTVRKDMARFYSNIVDMDNLIGGLLQQLEEDGLLENTIIFFWSDHGDGLPFAKRELYDRGLKIPLVIRFPGKKRAGERNKRLISTIDFAPTVLSLAGIKPAGYMQGSAFLGKYTAKEPQHIYAARDRMDSEYDRVRAVRDKRFKYIHNFHPELPLYQNIEYRLQQDMMKEMLELKEKGQLNSIQLKWFAPNKPVEELYEINSDPFELHNLASDSALRSTLVRMRNELDNWIKRANDLGAVPEKELVKRMWNGKDSPPVTGDILITVKGNKATLTCPTKGASIGYKIIGTDGKEPASWTVYTKPVTLLSGQLIKSIAQRIGYVKSKETVFDASAKPLSVQALRCDYLENPMGIESTHPLLSWQIQNSSRQTAYQIIVSSSPQQLNNNTSDVWNTGKVISGKSLHIVYNGLALTSRQQCFWKVRVWDEKGSVSAYSPVNYWEMGLLKATDWKAKWISRFANNDTVRPAPLFRKEVTTTKIIKKGRVYISGLGYYELYLNGNKVGDHLLDPVVTRYDKRVPYVSYDVTTLLKQGNNAIGVMLGNGWYNQHTRSAWDFDRAPWRNAPVLLCQLEVEYTDGSTASFYSDNTWKVSTGALVFDGIRNGETYDARLEKTGWNTINYNDALWQPAVEVSGPAGRLCSQLMPPIRVVNIVTAKTITQPKPNTWLVDFGIGMAGRVRLAMEGKAGTRVTVKYGEKLNADGTLDQKELARFIRTGETQTEHYIFKGDGGDNFSSRFVYYGFQYVEVSGWPGELTEENIVAEEVHTDLETAGTFECSNELLNKLHRAARQSFLSNYHSYPEDCPHREKIGWSGDAQLVAEMGLYNFDMTRAYLKWLDDFTDEQKENGQIPGIIPSSGWGYTYGNDPKIRERGYGPQWEGAYLVIPWNLYLYTGDSAILKKYYPALKRYVDYLAAHANNYILDFGIDDHKFFKTPTDPPIIATGHFYQLTVLLGKIAAVTGNEKDAARYTSLAQQIKQAYNKKFYQPATAIYGNGGQTSLGLALWQGLTEDANKAAVIKNLLDSLRNNAWHFDAGVFGVKSITNILTAEGYVEELYTILTRDTYPSFGNWLSKGATTLWQDWQGERSLDHIMFGSFTDFFYKGLVGINPDPQQPGFKHILLSPHFVKDLQWVKGSHHSPYGWITSEWKREGNKIIYTCVIPANTTATLEVNKSRCLLGPGRHRVEF